MNDPQAEMREKGFFRCPVQENDAAATIFIRRTKIPCRLQDKSIDGFSVLVERPHVHKLKIGPQWVLQSEDEWNEVWAQWMFNAPDGRVQLGLRRLRDLTPPPLIKRSMMYRTRHFHTENPELLFAGVVLVLFLTLSLPGLGDKLGTSKKIQNGVQIGVEVVRENFKRIW